MSQTAGQSICACAKCQAMARRYKMGVSRVIYPVATMFLELFAVSSALVSLVGARVVGAGPGLGSLSMYSAFPRMEPSVERLDERGPQRNRVENDQGIQGWAGNPRIPRVQIIKVDRPQDQGIQGLPDSQPQVDRAQSPNDVPVLPENNPETGSTKQYQTPEATCQATEPQLTAAMEWNPLPFHLASYYWCYEGGCRNQDRKHICPNIDSRVADIVESCINHRPGSYLEAVRMYMREGIVVEPCSTDNEA